MTFLKHVRTTSTTGIVLLDSRRYSALYVDMAPETLLCLDILETFNAHNFQETIWARPVIRIRKLCREKCQVLERFNTYKIGFQLLIKITKIYSE